MLFVAEHFPVALRVRNMQRNFKKSAIIRNHLTGNYSNYKKKKTGQYLTEIFFLYLNVPNGKNVPLFKPKKKKKNWPLCNGKVTIFFSFFIFCLHVMPQIYNQCKIVKIQAEVTTWTFFKQLFEHIKTFFYVFKKSQNMLLSLSNLLRLNFALSNDYIKNSPLPPL